MRTINRSFSGLRRSLQQVAPEEPPQLLDCLSLLRKFDWRIYFHCYYLSCSFLFLLPLFLNININSNIDCSILTTALSSVEFKVVIGGTIALAAPLSLDLFLDFFSNKTDNYISRVFLLIVLIIPSVVFMIGPDDVPSYSTVFACLLNLQQTNWSGIILAMLSTSDPIVFNKYSCTFTVLTQILTNGLDIYRLMVPSETVDIAYVVFKYSFYGASSLLMMGYQWRIYNTYKATILTGDIRLFFKNLPQEEFQTMSIFSAASVSTMGTLLLPFLCNRTYVIYTENLTADFLTGFYSILSIVIVLIVVLPGRNAKFEATKLHANLELKRNFVRYVGHEIRTPLNTLHAGLELLEIDYANSNHPPDCERATRIVEMRESCATAVEILNDLLQYEKLESGIMKLELSTVNPLPYINKVLAPFELVARQKCIRYDYHQDDNVDGTFNMLVIDIDQAKFGQVLRNFVSNAFKFTPKGGEISVTCAVVPTSDKKRVLRFQVKDTGHGIEMLNQRRVFHEIVQFNANTQQGGGGSGIGLWISRQIVELHGGKVGLFSQGKNTGCTFWLELPCRLLAEGSRVDSYLNSLDLPPPMLITHSVPQVESTVEVNDGTFSNMLSVRRQYHALVVDDSAANRKIVVRMLKQLGHRCTEAADGLVAVDAYSRLQSKGEKFDVVFMDNMMPNMTGPDATEMLREMGYEGPLFAVTGNGMQDDIDEFQRKGANEVLIKPVGMQQLVEVLKDLETKTLASTLWYQNQRRKSLTTAGGFIGPPHRSTSF